jgi:hypothetical protein
MASPAILLPVAGYLAVERASAPAAFYLRDGASETRMVRVLRRPSRRLLTPSLDDLPGALRLPALFRRVCQNARNHSA